MTPSDLTFALTRIERAHGADALADALADLLGCSSAQREVITAALGKLAAEGEPEEPGETIASLDEAYMAGFGDGVSAASGAAENASPLKSDLPSERRKRLAEKKAAKAVTP